jgi:hypothetical protein
VTDAPLQAWPRGLADGGAPPDQAQHGGARDRRLFLVPSRISLWKAAYPPSSGKSSQVEQQSLDPTLGITSQHILRCEAAYPPPPPLLTTEVTKQSRCFKPSDTRLAPWSANTQDYRTCWVLSMGCWTCCFSAGSSRGRADGAPGPHPPPAPSAHTGYTLAGAAAIRGLFPIRPGSQLPAAFPSLSGRIRIGCPGASLSHLHR